MRISIQSFLLLTACGLLYFSACKKYKDPPAATPDPRLTNHYCNDPRAVNYNRGFPGIPDNTTCIYPVDSFIGTWAILDSVFRVDQSYDTFENKTLTFAATEDTSLTHLAIGGWCSAKILLATANKYQRADLDSMNATTGGQLLCSVADTISGYFFLKAGSADTLLFQLQVNSGSGIHLHKGRGVRQ
jgi:hypothetical protein